MQKLNTTNMGIVLGRDYEVKALQKCMKSDRSELVLVCGRRRVGKTYLIEQYFGKKYAFSFVGGHNAPPEIQLRNFKKALIQYGKFTVAPEINSWYDAFDALELILTKGRNRKKVVFIDEMPWIDNPKSQFVAALENFWNGFAARRNDIVFIASGSATSWMNDKIINNQGGLHNRVTLQLYLKPFTLKETEEYLLSRNFSDDRYQMVQTYMVTGGVPYYLSLLDSGMSIAQNIDALFFNQKGALRHEFTELYPALFKKSDSYISVVRTLNQTKSGLTRSQISQATGIEGGTLTKILRNLELCDFIKSFAHFGRSTKDCVYRLTDFYSLFYFRFLESDTSMDENFWTHNLNHPSINAWQGITFETVCMTHIKQIKEALKISGISTEVSTWRNENAQIDLVIKRADRMINLCEIKFCTSLYTITADYAAHLRQRQTDFVNATNTRYGICNTFITLYGVDKGKNTSVMQSEITAADLFL